MKVSGLQVFGPDGREIENPTPSQVRLAILQLLEATGAQVIKMEVHGLLAAYVMPGGNEIPDVLAAEYNEHTITLAEAFVRSQKELTPQARAATARAKRSAPS